MRVGVRDMLLTLGRYARSDRDQINSLGLRIYALRNEIESLSDWCPVYSSNMRLDVRDKKVRGSRLHAIGAFPQQPVAQPSRQIELEKWQRGCA